MAIFDERATGLPEPDTRGLGASGKGPSSAAATQKGVEGLQGFLGVALQTDATQATEEHRSDLKSLESAETVQTQVGEFSLPEIGQMQDEVVVKELTGRFNALQQSRLKSGEFDLRREVLLREAIDKRPHLATQFRTLNNLYGGTAGARSASASAKQSLEEQRFAAITKAADAKGLPMNEYLAYQEEATGIQRAKSRLELNAAQRLENGALGAPALDQVLDTVYDDIDLDVDRILTSMANIDAAEYPEKDFDLEINRLGLLKRGEIRDLARQQYPNSADNVLRSEMQASADKQLDDALAMLRMQNEQNATAPGKMARVRPLIVQDRYIKGLTRGWKRTHEELIASSDFVEGGNIDTAAFFEHVNVIGNAQNTTLEGLRKDLMGGLTSVYQSTSQSLSGVEPGEFSKSLVLLNALTQDYIESKKISIEALNDPNNWKTFQSDIVARFLTGEHFAYLKSGSPDPSIAQHRTQRAADVINSTDAAVVANNDASIDLSKSATVGQGSDSPLTVAPSQLMEYLKDPVVYNSVSRDERLKPLFKEKLDTVTDRLEKVFKENPEAFSWDITEQDIPTGGKAAALNITFKSARSELPNAMGTRSIPERSRINQTAVSNDIALWNLYTLFATDTDINKVLQRFDTITNSEGSDLASNNTESQDPQG